MFSKSVTSRSYTATVGLSGDAGVSDFGTATVAEFPGKTSAVSVETYDDANSLADRGFHLIVHC